MNIFLTNIPKLHLQKRPFCIWVTKLSMLKVVLGVNIPADCISSHTKGSDFAFLFNAVERCCVFTQVLLETLVNTDRSQIISLPSVKPLENHIGPNLTWPSWHDLSDMTSLTWPLWHDLPDMTTLTWPLWSEPFNMTTLASICCFFVYSEVTFLWKQITRC